MFIDSACHWLLSRLNDPTHWLRRVDLWDATSCPSFAAGHTHAVPTLVIALEGVVRISASRHRLDLHPGEGLLVSPGACHLHEGLRPGSAAFQQGFVPGSSDVALSHAQQGGFYYGLIPSEPSWRLICRAAMAKPDIRLALIGEDLERLVTTEHIRSPGAMPDPVRRMSDRIWWGPLAGLHITDVVRTSGLRPSQAHALFKAYFGITPKKALAAHQTGLALQALREGADPVMAMARAGFSNRVQFTRTFRRRYGTVPSQWRKLRDTPPP